MGIELAQLLQWNISNEYCHGEGESLIELVLKYGVLNMLRGKAEGAPDLNLEH
jgi:hypothetical protein